MNRIISVFKKLSKSLKTIDIYGRKTDLTLNHEVTYKTAIGGFSTLIIVILSFLLFFNFGSDMIYHENPSSIFSEIYSRIPEREYFSKDNYFFMFGVEGPDYAHFIDENVYSVSFLQYSSNKLDNNQSFIKKIDLERCSEAHLPSDPKLKEYFLSASGSPIDRLFCAKNLDDLYIEGAFDADIFIYLKIFIKSCTNKTDSEDPNPIICKPIEDIKKKMSGFFAFYSVDYLIDPQNFENPGQAIGKDYFSPISVGMTRNVNRFIESTKINSDDGILLTSKSYYKYPTLANDKETLSTDPTNGENLLTFALRKSHSNHVYERSYKKIQRCLAEIGGFTEILYLVFLILNYPFAYKKYFEKIINIIYNFEEDGENQVFLYPIDNNRINPDKNIVFSVRRGKKIDEISKENFMKYMSKIKNRLPLKMTYCEYIKSFLFSKRKKISNNENKYERLMIGKSLLEEKLDISYIMKKFYEIDKLKMILLNENQYNLFDYLPKPVILKNKKIGLGNTKSHIKICESDDENIKAKNLYISFQNIMKQSHLSSIDKKLIDLLDENVKTLLEVIHLYIYLYRKLLIFIN